MTNTEFLDDFRDILQRDDPFGMDTPLADMEEWDSLSMMATIAYFDKIFAVPLTFEMFKNTYSVADIAAFVPNGLQEAGA